jgi:hypothetical protein
MTFSYNSMWYLLYRKDALHIEHLLQMMIYTNVICTVHLEAHDMKLRYIISA